MANLKMHSPDLSQDYIAKIRELFPGCVTEALNEATGVTRLAVDFDQLRQELDDHIVEGPKNGIVLIGRENGRHWHWRTRRLQKRSGRFAKRSVNFEQTGNLVIEGDNLEALKLLQESYLGEIKVIYIDPPITQGGGGLYLR